MEITHLRFFHSVVLKAGINYGSWGRHLRLGLRRIFGRHLEVRKRRRTREAGDLRCETVDESRKKVRKVVRGWRQETDEGAEKMRRNTGDVRAEKLRESV